MEVNTQLHAPAALTLGKQPYYVEGCVGLRASLDVTQKRKISCPYRESNPLLPNRQTLGLVGIPTEPSRL
jgi:hypothetical protein